MFWHLMYDCGIRYGFVVRRCFTSKWSKRAYQLIGPYARISINFQQSQESGLLWDASIDGLGVIQFMEKYHRRMFCADYYIRIMRPDEQIYLDDWEARSILSLLQCHQAADAFRKVKEKSIREANLQSERLRDFEASL